MSDSPSPIEFPVEIVCYRTRLAAMEIGRKNNQTQEM